MTWRDITEATTLLDLGIALLLEGAKGPCHLRLSRYCAALPPRRRPNSELPPAVRGLVLGLDTG